MSSVLLILGVVALNTAGQVALKKATAASAAAGGNLLALLPEPLLYAGLACYGASLLLWLTVLGRTQLSLAYPMVALGYVLVTLAAWLFLGENVPPLRWAALALIVGGVALLGTTSGNT